MHYLLLVFFIKLQKLESKKRLTNKNDLIGILALFINVSILL